MKKNSFMGSMFLIAISVTVLFIACQKEQNTVSSATDNISSDANLIVAVDGKNLPGLISQSSADELRNEFLKTAGPNESQYVQFSIKSLVTYLNAMTAKYGSDKVYVNFGVYDANTVPNGNQSYIGRKTVFFTVNNTKHGGSGNVILNDLSDTTQNSFNHGQIFP
jgi:nitrous oxide reductase accessory protein NosL